MARILIKEICLWNWQLWNLIKLLLLTQEIKQNAFLNPIKNSSYFVIHRTIL
jgi:hypothetical protein